MVVFLFCVIISVVVGGIWMRHARNDGYLTKGRKIMTLCVTTGFLLGLVVSFWGGSVVKKEIVEEKYLISPMFFNGKPIVALKEDRLEYIFQIIDSKTGARLIRRFLSENEIFFTDDNEGRYLKVRKSKICGRRMWIWFFCVDRIVKSEAVFNKRDNFLILPSVYSL